MAPQRSLNSHRILKSPSETLPVDGHREDEAGGEAAANFNQHSLDPTTAVPASRGALCQSCSIESPRNPTRTAVMAPLPCGKAHGCFSHTRTQLAELGFNTRPAGGEGRGHAPSGYRLAFCSLLCNRNINTHENSKECERAERKRHAFWGNENSHMA